MKRLIPAAAVAVLMVTLTAAETSAAVTGTVTDTNGDPVAGAVVTFIDESNTDSQFSGTTDALGAYSIKFVTTAVDDAAPQAFSLGQNYPNPFNPATTIPFSLDARSHVTLSIYNIMGQRVSTIVDAEMGAGHHALTWDGMDETGNHVSAGIYLYRLQAGGHAVTKKMLLLDGGGNTGGTQPVAQYAPSATGSRSAAKTTALGTFTVTITHENIEPYEESGIAVGDGDVLDFVVEVRGGSGDLPDGLKFVTIPAVTEPYVMNFTGDGDFKVTLSSYEMSTTEVTNAQYVQYLTEALASGDITVTSDSVKGASGDWIGLVYLRYSRYSGQISYSGDSFTVDSGCDNRPAVVVTWCGAKAFAVHYGLDLPTEAEWQYAASGGMNYEYGTVDGSMDSSKANSGDNVGHATDVGSYPANPLGLYDMAGNVWEWCHDRYGSYPTGTEHNYAGVQSDGSHVCRGGCWIDDARTCHVVGRAYYRFPYGSDDSIGFRVVRRPGGVVY